MIYRFLFRRSSSEKLNSVRREDPPTPGRPQSVGGPPLRDPPEPPVRRSPVAASFDAKPKTGSIQSALVKHMERSGSSVNQSLSLYCIDSIVLSSINDCGALVDVKFYKLYYLINYFFSYFINHI